MTTDDSFTNQQPRIATAKDCTTAWSMSKNGLRFRCGLCGHRFVEGDTWRWVYADCTNIAPGLGMTNFFTCQPCDGDDVRERMAERWRELYRLVPQFFFFFDDDDLRHAERIIARLRGVSA